MFRSLPYKISSSLRGCSALLALLLLLLAGTVPTQAQTTNATVSGTVTDPSGASIAAADVTAQNTGTGLTQTATSSDAGTSSGNFGQITSIGPIAPRLMQAALKLTF